MHFQPYIRKIGPKYIRDFFSIRETSYSLRGSGAVNLCVPKFDLNFMRNSFTYKCAQWNKLPEDVKLADNVNIFKSKLRSIQLQFLYFHIYIFVFFSWSLAFSRATGRLHAFTSSCHWLPLIISFTLIGRCDYFGFGFRHSIEKRSTRTFNIKPVIGS